jgi:ribosome-binding factor A
MSHRIERINNLIRQEISQLIQHQAKDPRLDAFVSVTEVSTSPDLKYAKIFISCINGQAEKEKILKALQDAAGYMRTVLSRKMSLRRVPELSFHWDDSIEHGDRIIQLLDQIDEEREG